VRIIYVDDERPARDNFRLTMAALREVSSLELFQYGEDALRWAREHPVDVAFLDMEMPGIHGLGLALKLREINENTRVVFVTAYSQYAMDAWGVDAVGYVMKPYSVSDIQRELKKCRYRPMPSQRVVITTIPDLILTVDGSPLHIAGAKPRELFALLVDRGDRGITSGEGIACLWPDRGNDANTQSLFRMTYKRLANTLEDAGVGYIIASRENRRYLRVDQVDCDLYRILSGDERAGKQYDGQYMREYSWAEERNGQLHRMLLGWSLMEE